MSVLWGVFERVDFGEGAVVFFDENAGHCDIVSGAAGAAAGLAESAVQNRHQGSDLGYCGGVECMVVFCDEAIVSRVE